MEVDFVCRVRAAEFRRGAVYGGGHGEGGEGVVGGRRGKWGVGEVGEVECGERSAVGGGSSVGSLDGEEVRG